MVRDSALFPQERFMEISAKEQLLLDEDALLELDWKGTERESWEVLDFANDEDDDLLLGGAPPLDPNSNTHCCPANPDDCNPISLVKFPVSDDQTNSSSLNTQIASQLKTDDYLPLSMHGRFHSFSEETRTCAKSRTLHLQHSAPSLDKKTEQDSHPTRPANKRIFQDFNFPSKSCSFIQSCNSLFGSPTRTFDTIDISGTASIPDYARIPDAKSSFAEDSLHDNRKISSSLNSDVIDHAEECISKCQAPSSIAFENTAIRNHTTIKLNGRKRFRYVPVGLSSSPKKAITLSSNRRWSDHKDVLFTTQRKGKWNI